MDISELQQSNANYTATEFLVRIRALFERDNELLGGIIIRSVLIPSPVAIKQHIMTRVDVLPKDKSPGRTEILDYGTAVFVKEPVSRDTLLERLGALSERCFKIGEYTVTSSGLGFHDDYEPSRNSYSDWPCRVFNVSFGSVYLPHSPFLHPKLKSFPSIYDAIQEFFELENFNGQSDGRLGQLQLVIPNLNARIESLTLSGKYLTIKTSAIALPNSLKVSITYKHEKLSRTLEVHPQASEVTCELAFAPRELSIWVISQHGFLADFHSENLHFSNGANPVLPKVAQGVSQHLPDARSGLKRNGTPRDEKRVRGVQATGVTAAQPVKRGRSGTEFPLFETPAETYTSQRLIQEGATAKVFQVTDSDGKDLALKCLKPETANRTRVKRFLNELDFSRRSPHLNVIQIIDQGFVVQGNKKCPFYVMPRYSQTLRDLMKKGISHSAILPLFSLVLDGVESAHLKNVWHRDLKPENILCEDNGKSLVVADFGIAHFKEEELYTVVQTGTHDRLANFQYAAPEQRARGGAVDHRADIFALGLILNEAFTGEVLQGPGYLRVGQAAPEFAYLDEIVEKMAQQSPDNRPSSIDEIKKMLLAKKNAFVSRQKLDQLRNTVVPASEVTDPFLNNPVAVTSVDVRGNTLVAILNQEPPLHWIRLFATQRLPCFTAGAEPVNWKFDEKEAMLRFDPQRLESESPAIFEYLKSYVQNANAQYVGHLYAKAREREADQTKALQEEIAEQERRRRILAKLKI